MPAPNLYSLLGVSKSATQEEIKAAYRRAALDCHPDRHPGDPEKAARFREVSAAWEVLGNAELRAKYDAGRWTELPEAARIVLHRLGEGLISGVEQAVINKVDAVGARYGETGRRAALVAGEAVVLGRDVALHTLKEWLGK